MTESGDSSGKPEENGKPGTGDIPGEAEGSDNPEAGDSQGKPDSGNLQETEEVSGKPGNDGKPQTESDSKSKVTANGKRRTANKINNVSGVAAWLRLIRKLR